MDDARNHRTGRRSFLMLALCSAAIATRVGAQQSGHIPVVGLLITHPPVTDKVVQALRKGLQQYGYEDGKNVRLEVRTALGQVDRIPELARELVRLPADVIVLVNELALRAVREATTTIPIVTLGYTDDPVSMGWIESYRRPGGNVTGIFAVNSALAAKRMEMLKETLPKVSRVAVLWNPPFARREIEELQRAAEFLRVSTQLIEVADLEDIESAFGTARKSGVGAAMLMWSPLFYIHRARVAELALGAVLPTFSDLNTVAEAGALLSYGSDSYVNFERAAYFVDRLLKGADAANLPMEQVSKLMLVVNLKTAKTLGITIPQSILIRADEVIR